MRRAGSAARALGRGWLVLVIRTVPHFKCFNFPWAMNSALLGERKYEKPHFVVEIKRY
jgi:hypothetical protein